MMKKKWMQIVAVGMSVMMLTACGSAGKSSESKGGSDFPKKANDMNCAVFARRAFRSDFQRDCGRNGS